MSHDPRRTLQATCSSESTPRPDLDEEGWGGGRGRGGGGGWGVGVGVRGVGEANPKPLMILNRRRRGGNSSRSLKHQLASVFKWLSPCLEECGIAHGNGVHGFRA